MGKKKILIIFTLVVLFALQYFIFAKGLINPIIYSIKIHPKSIIININESTKIVENIGIVPFYAKRNIEYTSDNPNVATVSQDGTILGISEGVVVIRANLSDISAETSVWVTSSVVISFAHGKYIGGVSGGLRDGYGVMYYENGNVYEGYFKDDIINGFGTMIWKNKNKYEGNFKNEQFDGFGKLERKNEYTYVGGWLNGHFEGFGEIIWENKNSYKGNFKSGQLSGFGAFEWSSKDNYIGNWNDGKRSGYGIYVFNRGKSKYVGFWEDNLRIGYGLTYTNDQIYYAGNYEKDIISGYGKLYNNGVLDFEGEFENGSPVK